jgi:hypothetical protein
MMRRAILLSALAASLVSSANPAAAKGNIPTRSYAIITGPGLSHPIVFVAAWKKSFGGFYTGEGERFLAIAGGTGALPAGKEETDTRDYVPSGVLPIDEVPSRAARGPRYRLTWFRDGVKDVANQNIYPYAPAGPLVYTFPSSRRALIVLFGRFQAPDRLWTGWGRATDFDLKMTLQFYGLPPLPPAAGAGQGDEPPRGTSAHGPGAALTIGAVVPTSDARPLLGVALSVVFVLVVVAAALLWLNRRRRETDPVAGFTG